MTRLLRRIIAMFRRKQPTPPVKWVNPKPWSPLGRNLVRIHIDDLK